MQDTFIITIVMSLAEYTVRATFIITIVMLLADYTLLATLIIYLGNLNMIQSEHEKTSFMMNVRV